MMAPLTVTGAAKLRAELENLKSVKRPAVIHAIAEARAHGDLKENAEYHAAREQQGFIEGRIQELEYALSHVVFGATVDLADSDTGDEVTYKIVGDLESDIKQRLISISSPMSRAMIGKHEGDSITIEAPGGNREFDIIAVSYVV